MTDIREVNNNNNNYKKHICGLQSIVDKCRICGTEGETIEHIISSCTVLAQSEYKKRHDIPIRKNDTHEFSS
jgi:hypothetical protein